MQAAVAVALGQIFHLLVQVVLVVVVLVVEQQTVLLVLPTQVAVAVVVTMEAVQDTVAVVQVDLDLL
jgi:hypothetical protein